MATPSSLAIFACAALVMALVPGSPATDVVVGGPLLWAPSRNGDPNFYQDFINSQFPIRSTDALIFEWEAGDNVLFVNNPDFTTCNVMHSLTAWSAQQFLRFQLAGFQNQRLYFISGAPGHCAAGQKFFVDVYPAA